MHGEIERELSGGAPRYTMAQIALHWLIVLLVIEQYGTSGAVLRTHSYRPLGHHPDPFDQALHSVHTRAGLFIFGLVVIRLVLRALFGVPQWRDPLSPWRLRLSTIVQYALYCVLLAQSLTGAIAVYAWWPMSAAHNALFWALVVLVALHLGGATLAFVTRPRETLFCITGLNLSSR